MSGVVEKATTSAGWPESTARLCEPEAPNDWVNVTPSPAEVLPNAGGQGVVGLLRGRVGDQGELRARLPARAAAAAAATVSEEPPHAASAVATPTEAAKATAAFAFEAPPAPRN